MVISMSWSELEEDEIFEHLIVALFIDQSICL